MIRKTTAAALVLSAVPAALALSLFSGTATADDTPWGRTIAVAADDTPWPPKRMADDDTPWGRTITLPAVPVDDTPWDDDTPWG